MLKINHQPVALNHFPDGTLLIKENVPKDFENERSARVSWHFESNEELAALIYIVKHLKAHGVDKIHLSVGDITQQCQHDIPNASTQEGI
jgi:hypothetical protein